VRALHPADLLAVDDETLVAELGTDAPVAVGSNSSQIVVMPATISASPARTSAVS
jgi:hypothetical protein